MRGDERSRKVIIGLLVVLTLILVGWALRVTRPVTMPLTFAFFVALLVHPIQRWVAQRLPDKLSWMGVAAAMLAIAVVLALGAGALWLALRQVAEKAPQYADQLQHAWQRLLQWARAQNLPIPENVGQEGGLPARLRSTLAGALGSLQSLAVFLVLTLFFVLLMLLEATTWREKVRSAFAGGRDTEVLDSVQTIAVRVRGYLAVRTVISLISAVIEGLWLWAVGVDFALLWALLFFVLNYVPNVGSVLAAIPPTLVALLQLGLGRAALAVGGLVVIEQVMGNFIGPLMQGRRLSISPLVVLVSVVFWTWFWGVPGALLAVPLTVTIVIVCSHVPDLRPVALLLGRTADETDRVGHSSNGPGHS